MHLFNKSKNAAKSIVLSRENIGQWPKWKKLLDDDKVIFDAQNKLRYPHGAPVGVLILTSVNKKGHPIYKESADEWFDPDSLTAHEFIWSK